MITSSSPATKAAVLNALRECHRPLLLGHIQIDGDALGAAVALSRALRVRGCAPCVVLEEPTPKIFDFLVPEETVLVITDEESANNLVAAADLAIVLDNNAWSRLGFMEQALRNATFPVICIDHHPALVPFSALHFVDTRAAATGLLVLELLEELGWPLDAMGADALYTAFVNDTGWFRWSNTDARVFAAAERLLRAGAKPERVAAALGQRESLAGKKLLGRFLEGVTLSHNGRLALGCVTHAMFASTGATRADSEDFVNQLRSIEGVEIAAFLREESSGVKLSFRTRAPASALRLALQFEGGGHVLAAGGRHLGPLQATLDAVNRAVSEELERAQA